MENFTGPTTGERRVRLHVTGVSNTPTAPEVIESVIEAKRFFADRIDRMELLQKQSGDQEQKRVCAQAMTLCEDACEKYVKALTATSA